MKKRQDIYFIFVAITLLAFLFSLVSAASSYEDIESEMKKLSHYAEEYETGNIDYVRLLLYITSIRENLNEKLGATSKREGGIFDREQLEKSLGEPTEFTKWVWVEREEREKRLENEVPVWRKPIFDGKKIQIRLEAFPSLFRKHKNFESEDFEEKNDFNNLNEKEFEGEEFLVYRLHFQIEFKRPQQELNINERIEDIKELAESFDANPSKENAELLAKESVNLERAFESFYRQSSLQCEAVMENIFGSENKRGTQEIFSQEFVFFEGDNFDVKAHLEMCEKCNWNWVNLNFWVEGRGPGFDIERDQPQDPKFSKEKYKNFELGDFEKEASKLLGEFRAALENKESRKAMSIKNEFWALNEAWNEKANNVWEEIDREYKIKRESMGEEEQKEYHENFGWIKDEQERREKEREIRLDNFRRRKEFYSNLFIDYEKKESYFTQEEYEKRLIEKFREFGEEQCNNNIDDNENGLIDCQEDQCGGKICGEGEVEVLMGNETVKERRDFYCIEKICQPKEELIKEQLAVCGNHICEENEEESCSKDCTACVEHEAIECKGRVIFKGKDELGCPLEPICLEEETSCKTSEDCVQPLCGVAECVEEKCQVAELTQCREPECVEGNKKVQECETGEEIIVEECLEGLWKETGIECEGGFEEIEEPEEPAIGEECIVKSDCGNENDVCSNGRCVTLPGVIEKIEDVEEEIEEIEQGAEDQILEDEADNEIEEQEEREVQLEPVPEEEQDEQDSNIVGNLIFSFFKALNKRLSITGLATDEGSDATEGTDSAGSDVTNEETSPETSDEQTPEISNEEIKEERHEEDFEEEERRREREREEELERRQNECEERCEDECYHRIIVPCVESCIWDECGQELECNIDEERKKCEAVCRDEGEADKCSNECTDKCVRGEKFQPEFEEGREKHKEEKGVFNVGGMCRIAKSRKEAFIWFGGWGEPFGEIQNLKHKYYSGGEADWCKNDLENILRQRKEFEKSFNENFVIWFFEKYLANTAEEWEQHVSGIFELYWRDVEISREMIFKMQCLRLTELPKHELINVKYETQYGSLEFWEEVRKARLPGIKEEVDIITPYMKIWIFPPKEFIEHEMKTAMEKHEFPGSEEEKLERESEGGPTEEEREQIKQDKQFMRKIRKITEKYEGEVNAFVQFKDLENDEIVFNLYVIINENEIINMKPMLPSEVPSENIDLTVTLDFDEIYEMILIHEREMRGAELESPPWDRKPRFASKLNDIKNGVKIYFKLRSIVSSAEVQPESARDDVIDLFKNFVSMMIRGGGRENIEGGDLDKDSEFNEEELPADWEEKGLLTGEVIRI